MYHSNLYHNKQLPYQIEHALLKKLISEVIIILSFIAITLNIINQFN